MDTHSIGRCVRWSGVVAGVIEGRRGEEGGERFL